MFVIYFEIHQKIRWFEEWYEEWIKMRQRKHSDIKWQNLDGIMQVFTEN